jgi:ATP-dependent RNA/DNA helicase IGHMBP2
VIIGAAITNTATKALSGIDHDYAAVCADLSSGWTLCATDRLAQDPSRLQIIGRRYTYTAQLNDYVLPPGLCVCRRDPCVCQGEHLTPGDDPGVLLIVGARARKAWDESDEDVLRLPRHDETFNQTHDPLDDATLALLTERWDYAHQRRAATFTGPIGHWKKLNEIRSFVAHEQGSIVRLAEQAWDPERFSEGQLVLLTQGPAATASAAREFVYRLPNLDVPLLVEDVGEHELIISCGDEDLVRIEQYLRAEKDRPLRLTLDTDETDRKIATERRTLRAAESADRLRLLIGDPSFATSTPGRGLAPWFNPELDPGQRHVVQAAVAADEILAVQGPPGTGKTTAICEIVLQHLDKDPHAKILLAAQTHQAVDNVLLRLTEASPDLQVARLGSKYTIERANEEIRKRYWIDSAEPWFPPTQRRADSYRQLVHAKAGAGDMSLDDVMSRVLDVQADYLASIGPQSTAQERLARASVIAGTCASVQNNPDVRAMTFAVAILEEAGKATPPEALMVALRSHKTIFVGDTRQLPPHIWDAMQTVLFDPEKLTTENPHLEEKAVEMRRAIEHLGSTPHERQAADEETLFGHFAEHLHGSEHEVTLNTQYRMLPPIGELVSEVFYGDIGGLKHRRQTPIDPRVQAYAGEIRVKLIDIPGQEEKGPEGKSKQRSGEVQYIRRELKALQHHAEHTPPLPDGPERLGVALITPYTAQAKELRRHIDLTNYPDLAVRVGIVDSFQGDEDQVVILSVAGTEAGFLKTPNRINVAVSRAQDLLIITTALHQAMRDRIGKPLGNVTRFIDQQVKQGDPAYQIQRPPQPKPNAQGRGGR